MTGPVRPERVDVYAAADAERLDVHAALNTYETLAAGQGIYLETAGPDHVRVVQADVIGANHRRLIVRDTDEGLYIGGCLITDPGVTLELAKVISAYAERAR